MKTWNWGTIGLCVGGFILFSILISDQGGSMFLIAAAFLILALLPTIIAVKKGRNVLGWFLYTIFLYPVALVHALCLKDESHKCPKCYGAISKLATVCPHCKNELISVGSHTT